MEGYRSSHVPHRHTAAEIEEAADRIAERLQEPALPPHEVQRALADLAKLVSRLAQATKQI